MGPVEARASNSGSGMQHACLCPPGLNRELTNLVQSEGTTISSSDQPYTRELFDREIDRYIEQAGGGKLSGAERFEFMKAHTKKADFFSMQGTRYL